MLLVESNVTAKTMLKFHSTKALKLVKAVARRCFATTTTTAKTVLKNFTKFKGKLSHWSLFFSKITGFWL